MIELLWGIGSDCDRIGIGLESDWNRIGIGLGSDWNRIGIRLGSDWGIVVDKLCRNLLLIMKTSYEYFD